MVYSLNSFPQSSHFWNIAAPIPNHWCQFKDTFFSEDLGELTLVSGRLLVNVFYFLVHLNRWHWCCFLFKMRYKVIVPTTQSKKLPHLMLVLWSFHVFNSCICLWLAFINFSCQNVVQVFNLWWYKIALSNLTNQSGFYFKNLKKWQKWLLKFLL